MGVFDWFRGAFGGDDEKKRRQQQKPQQPKLQQTIQPKQQSVNQLFGAKEKKNQINPVQNQLAPKPQAPRPQVQPAPRPAPRPTSQPAPKTNPIKTDSQDFVKMVTGESQVPKTATKIYRDKTGTVTGWDDATGTHLTKHGENIQRAKTGKESTSAKVINTVAGSTARVATGVAEGLSGFYDLVTPGKGTNRITQSLHKETKDIDKYTKEHGDNLSYKVLNVPLEIGTYFIPTTAATKIASKFPKGTKITADIVEKVSRVVSPEDAGRVRQALAMGMQKGLTLDNLIADQIINTKYAGEQVSNGEDITPGSIAANQAIGLGGAIVPGAVKRLFSRKKPDVMDDIVSEVLSRPSEVNIPQDNAPSFQRGYGRPSPKDEYRASQHNIRAMDNPLAEMQSMGLNPGDPADIPAFVRKKGDELVDTAQTDLSDVDDALRRQYAFTKRQQLADAVRQNPEYRDEIIKAYKDYMSNTNIDDIIRAMADGQIDDATRKMIERRMGIVKKIQDIRVLQKRADELLAKQGNELDAQVGQGEKAAQEAAAARAAQTNPNPNTIVEGKQPVNSPEVAANNGYGNTPRPTTEEELYGKTPEFKEKGRLSLPQLLSLDRITRENVTRPILEALDRGAYNMQTSKFSPVRGIGRLFTGINREIGVTPEVQTARMQLRGGVNTGNLDREAVANLAKIVGNDKESLTRVWATLDPEFAKRSGIDPSLPLAPNEVALQDKLKTIIDNTTKENLRRGLITPEQAANDSYIKRSYTVYDGAADADKFERGFRSELLKQYKGRKEVSDAMVEQAIKDPTYLVAKKTAESEAMWAMQDYGNFLVKNGNVSDLPRNGFVQLPDSPVFGNASGKYVPKNLAEDFTGFQYNNAIVSAFNDMITAYDRLGIRQAKKQLLTIFNPAVRLGNQVTNRIIFSQLGGINPIQFNIAFARVDDLIKQNHQLYREAVSQGLTGVDISQADFFAQRIAQASDDRGLIKKALDFARTSYSAADDKARITAYVIKRQQGYSPEEAARQVQRSFQDYKSVGFFYDMAAKTPLIGNAFVRFAADSVRIAKNAAMEHPLRTMGTIAAWSTLVNLMSVVSGESELQGESPEAKAFNLVAGRSKSKDQKDRENRFGAPKLPFTDISTAIQTPWGEVNVARFMPWYQLNDISNTQVSKLFPISENPMKPAGWQDPLLGQFAQIAADEDFRGKSIRDPEVNANGRDKYALDELPADQQRRNIARFLFANNAPLGKEIDQTRSAIQGKPDIFGKERSIPQAIARNFGLKVETYGKKQLKKNADIQAAMADKAELDKQLEGMPPAVQESWKRLTGWYKLHEQVTNEFDPTTMRNKKAPVFNFSEDKWKEYAAHPELYDLMVQKKIQANNRDGSPIAPEFDQRLSESFRKQLLQNKMVAPGDDAELDQRMPTMPEWDYYQKLKKDYTAAAKAKYGDTEFNDELVKNQDAPFPEKPDVYKAYTAAYALYTNGRAAKPVFTPAVKAAKEQYNIERFKWTNEARAKRGLPAITWDVWDNPTFGFDVSPSGGYGYGGSSGGSYNAADRVDTLTKLTSYIDEIGRLKPIEAQEMPDIVSLFQRLQAGGGGGRTKPRLGAGSKGA